MTGDALAWIKASGGDPARAAKAAGLVETRAERAKIVKKGELTRAIKVRGVAVTAGARAAIEAAGGSIE